MQQTQLQVIDVGRSPKLKHHETCVKPSSNPLTEPVRFIHLLDAEYRFFILKSSSILGVSLQLQLAPNLLSAHTLLAILKLHIVCLVLASPSCGTFSCQRLELTFLQSFVHLFSVARYKVFSRCQVFLCGALDRKQSAAIF